MRRKYSRKGIIKIICTCILQVFVCILQATYYKLQMGYPKIKPVHLGRKVQRIRELKGVKQETLAAHLGVTQQAVSNMEQSAAIDEDRLKKVAEALETSVEEIMNFSEEAVFNNYNYDNPTVFNYVEQYLHPVEKIVELYERLLKEKDEVIEMYKKQQKTS